MWKPSFNEGIKSFIAMRQNGPMKNGYCRIDWSLKFLESFDFPYQPIGKLDF